MKIRLVIPNILWIVELVFSQSGLYFNRFFEDKTLRMDVFHTGTSSEERFSLDELYQEPVWPDSKINLIDTLNFGKTLLTVFDLKTNRMIYSHGFSSIFSEWQTTTEARNEKRGSA